VVGELIGHCERPVPPSLGVDVLTVLAHAVRARRQEVWAALGLLAVWVGFFYVEVEVMGGGSASLSGAVNRQSVDADLAELGATGLWPFRYVLVCAGLLLARFVSGKRPVPYSPVERELPLPKIRSAGFLARWRRRIGGLVTLWMRINMGLYWYAAVGTVAVDPFPLIFPLAMALIVWVYRSQVETVLRHELGRDTFLDRPPTVALPATPRCRRVAAAVEREQHALGALYDAHSPFVGAGTPHQPWSFALELKRKKERRTQTAQATVPAQAGAPRGLTTARVVELVKEPLQQLRTATAANSIDRLRDLEIDDFVYLPAGVGREEGFYRKEDIEQHLREAVDEGGEGRRHFLRIRVGAWDEQVVVTVFVRVHTQGGMLVLEVAPHVLGPVREEFRDVDAVVALSSPFDLVREAVRALLISPTAVLTLGTSAARTLKETLSTVWEAPERRPPSPPLTSLRELASTDELSLFQEMDVSRYVKTVQDRIASGVRDALEQNDYQTDRFEQHIVNVSDGGLFIQDMSNGYVVGKVTGGAVAMGDSSSASAASGGST
jgi:hypothetical protein